MTLKLKRKSPRKQTKNLLGLILKDLLLQRTLLVLLVVFVTLSAIAVTWSTQKTRELNAQWAKLVENRDKTNLNWRKLRLEYRALAEHSRIEHLARKKLNMKPVTADKEKVIQ